MCFLRRALAGVVIFFTPAFAFAQTNAQATQNVQDIAGKVINVIINPIIALLMGVGLVVFMWGVVEFLWGLSNDTTGKETGKRHMLWGVIGMAVMACAFGLLGLIANTVCPNAGSANSLGQIQSGCSFQITN